MSTIQLRVTMLVSVDVYAIRAEQLDGGHGASDVEEAINWVEGEAGAPIDNHITIDSVESVTEANP